MGQNALLEGGAMETCKRLKHGHKPTVVFLLLALLIFSFACVISSELGFVLIPIVSVLLASLYFLDSHHKRILSFSVPLLLIAVELILTKCLSFNFVFSAMISIVLVLYFGYGRLNRTEAAAMATVLLSLSIALVFFISLAKDAGTFDIGAVKDHYFAIFEDGKEMFLKAVEQYVFLDANGDTITLIDPELASVLYDATVNLVPAVIVIIGFSLAGACLKAFSFVMFLILDQEELNKLGHFDPSITFAYFYLRLSIVAVFVDTSNVIGISILNLSSIFTAV
jgi:hypothetical protein